MPKTEKINPEFAVICERLQAIFRRYETGAMKGTPDSRNQYALIGPPTEATRGRECWFGAVRIGKSYVSYHLLPVYVYPELVESLSPELKKRMQGKACFNFKVVDEKLFKELEELTRRGYERFKKAKMII
jgi:hypothetical protein